MQAFTSRFISFSVALSLILGLSLAGSAAMAAPNYTTTDLGSLTNGLSLANGLNNSGTVVGYSATVAGLFDGFSWSGGTMTDLGLLSGGTFSEAYGVNDSGLIVGTGSDLEGNFHAIAWQNGQMTDLGFLSGGNQAVAMAVNASGVVVGYAYDSNNNSHAVIWTPSQTSPVTYSIQDLGTFSGVSSMAVAINSGGVVTGTYTDVAGDSHGFVWNEGTETDLGDLGGGQSFGEAINSSGEVVGQAMNASGAWHAFAWSSGQMTDLGALDGVMSGAFGINDSDEIVGESSSSDGTDHAVMWQGGNINDLGPFVGQNSFADAINSSGQIVGQGSFNSFSQGFLLTPVVTTPPVNPPVTTATFYGKTRNKSGWYTGPVTVALKATDAGGPGVAATYYTIDGGSQQTYSGTFTISGDAIHTLTYWSVDTSGNAETPNSQTVKIDTTPPVTAAELAGTQGNNGWYTSPVTVTLDARDALSGVANTVFYIYWWCPQFYSKPFTLCGNGVNETWFYSTDVAGNVENIKLLLVKIDTAPPVLCASGTAKSLGSGNWLVTIYGNARDNISGVSTPPTMTSVTDNEGSVSPSGVTTTMNRCDYQIQFTVNVPSTVTSSSASNKGLNSHCETGGGGSSSQSGKDCLNVVLQIQNNAGLTGTGKVEIPL